MNIVTGSVDGRSESLDRFVKISLEHVQRSRGRTAVLTTS